MKPVLLACATLAPLASSALASADAVPRVLAERLARGAATPGVTVPERSGLPAARVLFSHTGDDNACSLLVRPDADGDRVPDVVVGWDLFKTGANLEVLSGGGLGSEDTIWGLETADGISGGYFSDIDQLESYPDVTGDGVDELLTGTSGGGRAATLYDGATGVALQSFDTYLGPESGWVYDVEVVGDVNGNGTVDFALVTGSDADAVYMVDGGETGVHHEEIWSFQGLDAFYSLAVVGDLDGDGIDDLAAGSGDNEEDVHALSGADGQELWHRELEGSVLDLAAFPDVDGDGVDEIVAGTWSASDGVVLLHGATGDVVWTSGAADTFIMLTIPVDDLDGDGVAEIAVASWANEALVLDGRDGSVVWTAPSGGDVWAIDRVDDVTGDGLSEVVFGSFDGFAYLADGLDGTLLWSHDAGGHKVLAIRGAPDLDGDGHAEVVAGGQQLDAGEDDLVWVLGADSAIAGSGPLLEWEGPARPGGEIRFEVSGATPGRFVRWIWGSEPTLRPIDGLGTIAVRPANPLATGIVDADGRSSLTITIPDDPGLIGRRFYVQAVELDEPSRPVGATTERVGFRIER